MTFTSVLTHHMLRFIGLNRENETGSCGLEWENKEFKNDPIIIEYAAELGSLMAELSNLPKESALVASREAKEKKLNEMVKATRLALLKRVDEIRRFNQANKPKREIFTTSNVLTFLGLLLTLCLYLADKHYGRNDKQDEPVKDAVVLTDASYSVAVPFKRNWIATGSEDKDSKGAADVYDLEDGKIIESYRLSVVRNQFGASAIGSKIYFIGGYGKNGESSVIDIYDFKDKSWSTMELSTPVVGPAVASVGSRLVVAGGYYSKNEDQTIVDGGINSLRKIEIIDTLTNEKSYQTLLHPRAQFPVVSSNSKLFYIGGIPCYQGYTAGCAPLDNIETLDLSDQSRSVIKMPRWRVGAKAVLLDGKIYIAGGGNQYAPGFLDIYSIRSGEWQSIPISEPGPGSSMVASGNKVVIAGGTVNPKVIQVFNIGKHKISDIRRMSKPRYNLASVLVGTSIFFIGGTGEEGLNKDFEQFDLDKLD